MRDVVKRRIFNCVIFVAVVIALYFTAIYLIDEVDMANSVGTQIAFAGSVVLAIVLSTLFHELGHLLFGVLAGFKITAFHFLGITFSSNGIRFRASKNAWGYCSGILRKSSRPSLRFSFFIFGGLFGALCFSVFCIVSLFVFKSNPVICALFGGGSAVALACFLFDAFPISFGGVKTDGGYLGGLIVGNASVKVAVNCLLVEGQMANGIRISEIDQNLLFSNPVLPDDDVNSAVMYSHQYYYFLEKKDFENANKALSHIEETFEFLPDMYQFTVAGDLVYNSLTFLNDVEKAKKYLPYAKIVLENNIGIDVFRVKMAIELYIDDNPSQAILTGKAGLSLAEMHPIPVIATLESELIKELIKKATYIDAEKHK